MTETSAPTQPDAQTQPSRAAWRRFIDAWEDADEALLSRPHCTMSVTPERLEVHRPAFRRDRGTMAKVAFLCLLGAGLPVLHPYLIPVSLFLFVLAFFVSRHFLMPRTERLVVDAESVTVEQLRNGRVLESTRMPVDAMYLPHGHVPDVHLQREAFGAEGAPSDKPMSELRVPGLHLCDAQGGYQVFGSALLSRGRWGQHPSDANGEFDWLERKVGAYLRFVRGGFHRDAEERLSKHPVHGYYQRWLDEQDPQVPHQHRLDARTRSMDGHDFLRPLHDGEAVAQPPDSAIEHTEEGVAARFELPPVGFRGEARRAGWAALFSNLLTGGLIAFMAALGVGLVGVPRGDVWSWLPLGVVLVVVIAMGAATSSLAVRAVQAIFGRETLSLDPAGLTFERTLAGRTTTTFIPVDTVEGADVVPDVALSNRAGSNTIYSYSVLVYSFDADPVRIAPGRSKAELVWLASRVADYARAQRVTAEADYVFEFEEDQRDVEQVDEEEKAEVPESVT